MHACVTVSMALVVALAEVANGAAGRTDPASQPGRADRRAVIATAAAGESTWRRVQRPDEQVTSRELFTYALALCEADVHLDRLPRLLEVAGRMQDRDPSSRSYGNFRWYWRETVIRDYNAVDFCMMGGSLMWLRHRDRLPQGVRKTLRETLEYGAEGCLRHRVPSSYTNISLMNALDLILLGEGLDKPEVADEGYARLDRFCLYTWQWGIHEYCSPTYYGVDIECLLLIEAFCRRPQGRDQARALLELFWTDVALNWYAPAARLGGACSRDYRYLTGTGYLDMPLWFEGWLPGRNRGAVFLALGRWQPPPRLREMNLDRYPRLVRQSWGIPLSQSRTYYACRDVCLSASGANYGPMDLPLTVDLPGGRGRPRCYFIPDGRGDPYGTKKIDAGAHRKARHLRPFWAAAQRTVDALGLVVYRERSIEPPLNGLQSHFVLRRKVDGLWIGDKPVTFPAKGPASFPAAMDQPLVLRQGTAAVGVRVPWARRLDGQTPALELVDDGNKHGVVRLTVTHAAAQRRSEGPIEARGPRAAAVFWVRIGTDLTTDDAFHAWRRAFATAKAQVSAASRSIRAEVAGRDGAVAVGASSPYLGVDALVPTPTRAVLELDGEDLGRRILKDIKPIADYRRAQDQLPPVAVGLKTGAYVEAERGMVVPAMVVGDDPSASGGKYVWVPGEPGQRANPDGYIAWKLRVDQPGTYTVWGRVLAPTPDDDSFRVRVLTDTSEPVNLAEWHTGSRKTWMWRPMCLDRSREPTRVSLPAGTVTLELHSREDGTKIDRLFITGGPDARPK